MNKKEFLDILYEQLSGQMPEGNIAAHVQYYRNYIEEQQRTGRTESDILNELGDPRLIARTLLDTETEGSGSGRSPYAKTVSDYQQSNSDTGTVRHHSFKIDLSTWHGKLAVILIAAVVLILLFTVLSVLIPVMLVTGVILYLLRMFKNNQ